MGIKVVQHFCALYTPRLIAGCLRKSTTPLLSLYQSYGYLASLCPFWNSIHDGLRNLNQRSHDPNAISLFQELCPKAHNWPRLLLNRLRTWMRTRRQEGENPEKGTPHNRTLSKAMSDVVAPASANWINTRQHFSYIYAIWNHS